VKKYRPTGELKDHHDLIRIAAAIKTNTRRPRPLTSKMLHHITELLKLFAGDPTLGVRDPNFEAEEKRTRAEERRRLVEVREERLRKAKSAVLEEHVRSAEEKADANGSAPEYG
jgi:hypothetical protein